MLSTSSQLPYLSPIYPQISMYPCPHNTVCNPLSKYKPWIYVESGAYNTSAYQAVSCGNRAASPAAAAAATLQWRSFPGSVGCLYVHSHITGFIPSLTRRKATARTIKKLHRRAQFPTWIVMYISTSWSTETGYRDNVLSEDVCVPQPPASLKIIVIGTLKNDDFFVWCIPQKKAQGNAWRHRATVHQWLLFYLWPSTEPMFRKKFIERASCQIICFEMAKTFTGS